jgi:hypothetical protein
MRFVRTLSQLALLASAVCAAVVPAVEPKLDISAGFAEDNPFGRAYILSTCHLPRSAVFFRGREWTEHQAPCQDSQHLWNKRDASRYRRLIP